MVRMQSQSVININYITKRAVLEMENKTTSPVPWSLDVIPAEMAKDDSKF
jgi:hypothetical protein